MKECLIRKQESQKVSGDLLKIIENIFLTARLTEKIKLDNQDILVKIKSLDTLM